MSGLPDELKRRKNAHFSEEEKLKIIESYLHSGLSKKAIWKKYTGQDSDHGLLLYWMYKYGYISANKKENVIFTSKKQKMNPQAHQQSMESASDFEHLQLKRRISELETQLHESEMKAIAWKTMVEIAEREFHINIKKKFNIKPLKP